MYPTNEYYTLGMPIESFTDNGSFHTISRDHEGKSPFNTVFGEQIVGTYEDDVSVQFQYNNSTRDITPTTTGTGSITNVDSQIEVHVGLGIGEAEAVSRDSVRYRPGHEMIFMATTMYDVPEANVRQQHGLLDDMDGVSFGYEGTAFGIFFLEGGNEIVIPQTTWNVDKCDGTGDFDTNRSSFNLDPSKFNIYKISFGWLGIAPISFSVYGGVNRGWVTCHVIDQTNVNGEPHLDNPSLPITMRIERTSGSGADLHMHSSSWRASIIGGGKKADAQDRWFSFTDLEFTVVAGAEVPVFTLRNKGTFQGKNNHVAAELGIVRFTTDLNKSVAFTGVVNGSLTGASFTDINTANSIMSVDDSATAITGGGKGPETVMTKLDAERSDVRGTGIIIRPGDDFTLTVTAPAGSIGTVSASFRWLEKF